VAVLADAGADEDKADDDGGDLVEKLLAHAASGD